jgi:multiple sugar transport system permease protein
VASANAHRRPRLSTLLGLERGRLAPIWFVLPALIFLGLTSLYPLLVMLQMSVTDVTSATLLREWPFVGLQNFQEMAANPDFRLALTNTLVFMFIVVVFGVGGGFATAVALKRDTRINRGLLAILVLAWALPPVVSGSLWKFMLSHTGFINEFLQSIGVIDAPVGWLVTNPLPLISVALITTWAAMPFAAVVFRAALKDVPVELLEAAQIDGATPRQQLQSITFPLLLPTTVVLIVLYVVYAFRSFEFIFTVTGGGPGSSTTTLPFLGYRQAFRFFEFGIASAIAALTMLLIVGVVVVYVRAVRAQAESSL